MLMTIKMIWTALADKKRKSQKVVLDIDIVGSLKMLIGSF
jgi:hypothetical protein